MAYLIALCLFAVAAWYWLDSARARELATGIARTLCQRHGIQFLDETVTLRRTGLRWTANGLRIRRLFTVDYSIGDMGRRQGYVLLIGTRVEAMDLGLPKQDEEAAARSGSTAPEQQTAKVIRFPRRPGD